MNSTQALLLIAVAALSLAFLSFLYGWFSSPRWSRAGSYFINVAFLVLCFTIFLEAMRQDVYLPVANRQQSMIFFAWSVLLMFLFVRRDSSRSSFAIILIPLLVLLLLSALVSYRSASAIPPEYLSDRLFAVHTLSAYFAYAAFSLSFVTSALYLLQNWELKQRKGGRFYRHLPNLDRLEQMAFFTISLGVPLMALTLATGFLWSKRTFGHYWVWDPKVVFATVTWIFYTLVLYLRFIRSLHGTRLMAYALACFSAVLFTFVGSNVFHQKIHSPF